MNSGQAHNKNKSLKLGAAKLIQWLLPIAIFAAFFMAYSHTPTAFYTYDAVAYATQIRSFAETGRLGWLFHPHHLAFNYLGYAAWKAASVFDPKIDPLRALQYMNAFFAALSLGLLFAILRSSGIKLAAKRDLHSGIGAGLSFAAVVTFGCAYGFWVCATDGRVNIPAFFGVILTTGLAWGMLAAPSFLQCIAVALATVLAVALHQSNGLLLVAGTSAMLLSPVPWRKRITYALLSIILSIAGIAALYACVGIGIKGLDTISQLHDWVLAYSRDGRWWSFNVAGNLMQDAKALLHVFVSVDASYELIGHWLRWPVFGSVALMIGLFFTLPAKLLDKARTEADKLLWKYIAVLAAVAVPYAAFFTLWNPGYFVFWLPVGFAVIACQALAASRLNKSGRAIYIGMLMILAGAFSIINLHSAILPRMSEKRNPNLVFCNKLKSVAQEGDLALAADAGNPTSGLPAYTETYLPYFTRLSVRSISNELKSNSGDVPLTTHKLRGIIKLRMKSGHQVIILTDFLSKTAWSQLARRYSDAYDLPDGIMSGFKLKPLIPNHHIIGFNLLSAD